MNSQRRTCYYQTGPSNDCKLSHEEEPYLATTGPSAICTNCPSDSRRPSHFLLFLFLPPKDIVLSPPVPIHNRPSAVVAAMRPTGDIDIDRTNGGERDTPEDGCAAAANHV